VWFGGSESHTFNRLEEIAMSEFPVTPVLGRELSLPYYFLRFRTVRRNKFQPMLFGEKIMKRGEMQD
jgi:hypothetical protein